MCASIVCVVLATIASGCSARNAVFHSDRQEVVDWQWKGFNLPVWSQQGLYDSEPALKQLRATGANSVTFVVTWYVKDEQSSDILRTSNTVSDDSLIWAMQRAKENGLSVTLKPHIDLENHKWRAYLNPSEPDKWFNAYRDIVLHYAEIGQRYGATLLCIGSELISVSVNPAMESHWRDLITTTRQRFAGKLTYSANWGGGYFADPSFSDEFANLRFWDALDYLGVSAYFELTTNTTPSIAEMKTDWVQWRTTKIQPVQKRWRKPVLFTEVGYRSIDGSARAPWDANREGAPDLQEQSDCLVALFQAWKGIDWFAGSALWMWGTKTSYGSGDMDYFVQGKPAQQVVTGYFGGHVD